MCGICGKLQFNPTPIDARLLRKMCRSLSCRGPDDEGIYVSHPENPGTCSVGLGHRRLSIIDLSPAAHQPMCNEDESLIITYNGEIYNYKELRDDLIKKGHVFKSHTDTETIIHLYEEKGVECVHDLRGMFAFAIWDENARRLFCARDRAGKKPLVYTHNKGGLLFASEIKSLLIDPSIEKEIDYVAIHHYLTYQYVPSPLTIFKRINARVRLLFKL